MDSLPVGTVLHGRYRIVRQIGRGGMGAVYEAIDGRLLNTVAVKQLTADGLEVNRAFEREAQILASLRHPALPVVIDYFVEESGCFLVMQFIEGDDFSRLLVKRGGPLDVHEVRACARAVLEALAYLHRQSPPVVHRDVKPANLRRTPTGEIVLIDFGLAKSHIGSDVTGANDRSVYGYTPSYAPPEQVEWRRTDPRSDLYALGATLYHLVTGSRPKRAYDRAMAMAGGGPDPIPDPSTVNPRVDEPLSRAILRALALDPSRRFASAGEMIDAMFGAETTVALEPAPGDLDRDARSRRVDAAIPSQAEIGRQVDLLVQVRFADSPLLGIEDWPTRSKPDRIEQASEALALTYPHDPVTGRPMPAKVRIKIVAPDFNIAGEVEQTLAVPADNFSKRLAFLMTPRRAGVCRVNVEVYDPDALYLGGIAVEAEAVDALSTRPELRVANLSLDVLAQHIDKAVRAAVAAAIEPDWNGQSAPSLSVHSTPYISTSATPDEAAPAATRPAPTMPSTPAARSGLRKVALYLPIAVAVIGTGALIFDGRARFSPPEGSGQSPVAGYTTPAQDSTMAGASAPSASTPVLTQPPPMPSPVPPPAPRPTQARVVELERLRDAELSGHIRLAELSDGIWRGTIATTPQVTYAGPPSCTHTLTLRNVALVLSKVRGGLERAEVTAQAQERVEPGCASGGASVSAHRYTLLSASMDAGNIVLTYGADSSNAPAAALVFRGTPAGDTIRGTLAWHHDDPTPSLAWTMSAPVVLNKGARHD